MPAARPRKQIILARRFRRGLHALSRRAISFSPPPVVRYASDDHDSRLQHYMPLFQRYMPISFVDAASASLMAEGAR